MVIPQEKHRENPLLSEFSPKSGTFILVSNTYAKIPWHLLTNSFLAVNVEIKQGETALRSPWYLIVGLPDILNVTTLLKHSKTA